MAQLRKIRIVRAAGKKITLEFLAEHHGTHAANLLGAMVSRDVGRNTGYLPDDEPGDAEMADFPREVSGFALDWLERSENHAWLNNYWHGVLAAATSLAYPSKCRGGERFSARNSGRSNVAGDWGLRIRPLTLGTGAAMQFGFPAADQRASSVRIGARCFVAVREGKNLARLSPPRLTRRNTESHAASERVDCDRTVICGAQNLEEHRRLRRHTE